MVNRSKKFTKQLKAIENSNIVDIKLGTQTEYPKTSHKLSKTIMEAEMVFQVGSGKRSNSLLYSETKTVKIFWTKKM